MKKIMFVCHGNICRSPMAEFVMKKLVAERGLEREFLIESSATHTDEIWLGRGNPIYPPAREQLIIHSVDFDENKRAVLLEKEDYKKYDLFVCMDGENIRSMKRIFGFDPDGKCVKLMDFTKRGGDVSDPWYTRDFALAFSDIYEGCNALLEELLNNNKEF